jgi:uncharacterized phage protein gp47/JayE
MLARLSSSDYPTLAGLRTRDDNDFSIAFLDASAVMLDILTFYQERLANESFLRTATQLYSLTQLSQLIGYQPSPGVSASTYLAFTLTAASGLPTNPGTTAITIPAGTTVQSVPAQGQTPQSFQTSADILGKPDWNALPVQTGVPWRPENGQSSVYLQGTATQLQPGDAFLIVGGERLKDPTNTSWDLRLVSTVQPDATNERTLVTWLEPLGASGRPALENPKFYALRQRAALFGYNAINPRMLSRQTRRLLQRSGLIINNEWIFGKDDTTGGLLASEFVIDLDAVYAKLVPGGWIALVRPDGRHSRTPAGEINLFHIASTTSVTRSDYGMSGKITRVAVTNTSGSATTISSELAAYYDATRTTSVLAQSEELPIAEQPLHYPLYGTLLDLEIVRQDLAGVTAVALIGKRQKMTVNTGIAGLIFIPDDRTAHVKLKHVKLNPGDMLTLLQPPDETLGKHGTIPDWKTYPKPLTLSVADASGRSGTVTARLSQFTLAPAAKSDPVVQELALVSSITLVSSPFARTRIVLKNPLLNCYDRTATTVNANVGPATAGAPVTELLGNGAAATPNQEFTLKQSPLTYVQAVTPTGRQSSLQVRVNGAAWKEVPSLYNQNPSAQVFRTINLPGGITEVQFGDGVEGSTLPSGQNNVIANYRVGLGSAGNVGAGTITTLVDRPVGVSGVNNPTAATGGQDAQSIDDIRANAPQSVLTLGRAVSITDYQNFAATFAGIAKAYAIWIPNGVNRGVFLTVAGVGGAALPPGNLTLASLVGALQAYGNPNIAINVQSFYETIFRLSAKLAYDPAYDATAVQAAVRALLAKTYSFAARTFGQGVSGDEVATLIQGVPGVVSVNVTRLRAEQTSAAGDLGSAGYSLSAYNNWLAQPKVVQRKHAGPTRICPYVPIATPGALPQPAEILVLDPDPAAVVLEVMQ